MRVHLHRFSLLLVMALILSSAASIFGDEPTASVYVRDSATAIEKFALADRMQRLGEWEKAADVYQELLQTQADRVILSPTNPTQYVSVITAVQDRLCHWPAEGLEVYRNRFEVEASTLLQQAEAENRPDGTDDPALLHRIFANYFVTDSAKAAGLRLMDASIENGEFAAAAWIGQRLLDSHPMLLDDRPRVLFAEGIAHHLLGDDTAAAQQLSELQKSFPGTLGRVGGVDVVLPDALAEAIKHPPTMTLASSGESWPMPFGSADRSRLSVCSVFGGARIFGIDLDTSLPRGVGIPLPARQDLKRTADSDHVGGFTLGVLPAVDRGELFFQDNVHVYAAALESGLPLPGWQQTYGGEHGGRYSITGGGWAMPRCQQESICLTDDAVLAIMGQPDNNAVNLTGHFARDSRLVCLDRHTGRERWVCTPSHLPAEPAALRELDFGGSPLVVGDNVYLLARGGRGLQFEDCYIICLNLQTGDFKWASYLASANNTAQMWEMDIAASGAQNISHIAYSGGRLYVATNVGAVAAVDAYDGSVIWLNMYPREDVQPNRLMGAQIWGGRAQRNPSEDGEKPWTYNPVIVRDGKVFVMPSDGSFLHVFDAGSGAEIKRIGLAMQPSQDGPAPIETVDTLVGIAGDHGEWAILASDRSVFCIDWKNFDPTKGADNLRWAKLFAHGGGKEKFPDDSIRGRPFLTADSVFVPLAWQLIRLSLDTGTPQATFPASGLWDDKTDGPGNVLVTHDHLIIAGSQRVDVYTDISLATRKLDAAVAAAPQDPEPRLRYAEVLCAADVYAGPTGAAAKLDEAAALLDTNADAAAATSLRARLFDDALAFAQNITKEHLDPTGTLASRLYDRAAAAAVSPPEWVTYRVQRAGFFHETSDFAKELALYQQILADPQLRSVSVPSIAGLATPASTIARTAIAKVFERAGVAIYAPYEHEAQQAVQAAANLPDTQRAQQLVAVATMYPNSVAGGAALLDAADAYEAGDSPREAAGLLRQFCSRYPDSPDRARAVESLARAYLEMPDRVDGLNVAIGRLEQGAKLHDQQKLVQPLKLPDGSVIQNVTFEQAADALRHFQAQIETRVLPDPGIPSDDHRRPAKFHSLFQDDPGSTVANVSTLVLPIDQPRLRHDRVVTFSPDHGVSVFAVGSATPLFTCAAVNEEPNNCAWAGENLLVWSASRLFLIHAEDHADHVAGKSTTMPAASVPGTLLWDAPLSALPAVQFAAAGSDDDAVASAGNDDAQQPQNNVIPGGRRQIFRPNGVIVLRGGAIVNVPGGPIPQPLVNLPINPAVNPPVNPPVNPAGNPAGGETAVERISQVLTSGDRVVFCTTGGIGGERIVSMSLADGHVQWQTSLENHQIQQLAANDDFVVVRAISDADVRLLAFDALTGQTVWRPHAFGRDNNDTEIPINLALAEDGSLVYLLADRVCCKDLFDPDPKLRFDHVVSRSNGVIPSSAFVGETSPDQLLISDGRVLAVSDSGTFVRVYSLADGKPYKRSPDSEAMLNTEVTDSPGNVHLRIAGTRLYVFGPDEILHYDLDNVDDAWSTPIDKSNGSSSTSVNIFDTIVTRQHLLLFLEPSTPQRRDDGEQGAKQMFIRAYSRQLAPNGRESGSVKDFDRLINEPSGILQIQVVDGGVYYSTGSHELHFLRGSSPVSPATQPG